jgi:hypothetical protein
MQRKDGELIPTEPGRKIAVTHDPEQTLRDNSKNLISNSVSINIVDLLKAVQVQKDQGVSGAFSWWSGGSSLERVIKLPPVREPGQRVLESKCADMLLRRKASRCFPPLLNVSPHREGQQSQRYNRAEKQGFIEFDRSLMDTHAIGVFENVIFECQVQTDEKHGDQDRNVLETVAVPDHESSSRAQCP